MTFCRLVFFCLDRVSSNRDKKSFENSWASWNWKVWIKWQISIITFQTVKPVLYFFNLSTPLIYRTSERWKKMCVVDVSGPLQWGKSLCTQGTCSTNWASGVPYQSHTSKFKLWKVSCSDLPAAVLCPDPVLWPALKDLCTFCCCSAGVQTDTADAHRWTEAHNLQKTEKFVEATEMLTSYEKVKTYRVMQKPPHTSTIVTMSLPSNHFQQQSCEIIELKARLALYTCKQIIFSLLLLLNKIVIIAVILPVSNLNQELMNRSHFLGKDRAKHN